MTHPDPNAIYPIEIEGFKRVCFLKNIIKNPQIIVGDYTYYDDLDDVYNFEKNVLYLFDFIGDKLIIGKFCQIATSVRFIMNGANHAMDGISTYPFKIFGKSWQEAPLNAVTKGDTVIGNDVWIGNGVTFMPGVEVGDGAIIGSSSLVTKNIPPYSIVGGNPAQLIRKRFDDDTIHFLINLKWWDWDIDMIAENLDALTNANVEILKKFVNK